MLASCLFVTGRARLFIALFALPFLTVSIYGCGGFSQSAPAASSAGLSSANITISLPASANAPYAIGLVSTPASLTKIVIKVTAADMTTIIKQVDLKTLTASFDVPSGKQRTFTILASYNNKTQAAVSKTVDLTPSVKVDIPVELKFLTRAEIAQMMLDDIAASINALETATAMSSSIGHYLDAVYLDDGTTKANQFKGWSSNNTIKNSITSKVATILTTTVNSHLTSTNVVALGNPNFQAAVEVKMDMTDNAGSFISYMWAGQDKNQYWTLVGNQRWLQFEVAPYALDKHIISIAAVPTPTQSKGLSLNVRDPYGYAKGKGITFVTVTGPSVSTVPVAADVLALKPDANSTDGGYSVFAKKANGWTAITTNNANQGVKITDTVAKNTRYTIKLYTNSQPSVTVLGGTLTTPTKAQTYVAILPSTIPLAQPTAADFPLLQSPVSKASSKAKLKTAIESGSVKITWTNVTATGTVTAKRVVSVSINYPVSGSTTGKNVSVEVAKNATTATLTIPAGTKVAATGTTSIEMEAVEKSTAGTATDTKWIVRHEWR